VGRSHEMGRRGARGAKESWLQRKGGCCRSMSRRSLCGGGEVAWMEGVVSGGAIVARRYENAQDPRKRYPASEGGG